MSEEKAQSKVPKFDGHYDHWSELMENFLRAKGLWGIVERGIGEPLDGALLNDNQRTLLEEARTQDYQVKHYLFQAIDRSVFEQILDRSNSKSVWDSLKKKFGGNEKVKKATRNVLRREFELLEMNRGETINDYFGRVTSIANKLRSNGAEVEDTMIVEKILRTLTDQFTYIVVSVEESHDVAEMSVDELQSTLSLHEKKLKRGQREESDQVLQVESRFGGKNIRGRGNYRGRGSSSARGRGNFNKATIECYKCHNLGHFQYECPKWKKEVNYTVAEEEEEDDLLLMAEINDDKMNEHIWYVDSGCSNHMCKDMELFTTLDRSFTHAVKLGNNDKLQVLGKGNVKFVIDGTSYTISEVYFVPKLKSNLLSVGQFQEKGLTVLFKHESCSIYHPSRGEIIKIVMSKNRMFAVSTDNIKNQEGECLQVTIDDQAILWHQRYGHLHFKGLKTLRDKEMVTGLPSFKTHEIICADCLNGKQTRQAIPKKSNWRASKILELIHSDICGPINPTSNSGKRYFLTFIDDFSRKGWVYLLINKSEALSCFKEFKSMVEKDSGHVIKGLRTDRGGEYLSEAFKEYCKEHGIKRQLTTAYTPQQNGVAERRNRTIMNMVRSLLSAKKMPNSCG
ncbi:hypothetical protein LIER_02285 [Lithospermum erythrorhizon]|uniref:Retrovirus-related Pol polyprotein from transposon TNT 1-94 n=1 Tax=Lithospermum erythrorhizon TaxID=34254 RepID=A0AAV3NSM0_LITER